MEETPLTRVLVILSDLKSAASAAAHTAALSAPATIAGVTAAPALIAAAGTVTARHAFRHLSQHGISPFLSDGTVFHQCFQPSLPLLQSGSLAIV